MSQMRSTVVLAGAILGRFKEAKFSYPGGCDIGARPIDLHLSAFKKLGVNITEDSGFIICKADKIIGTNIDLDFPSVGATENIILASIYAEGITQITNAAMEPEIVDLAKCLNKMGAKITVEGKSAVIRGTRGAFIELFGIEEKDADGNKIDNTTEEANITNSTEVMLTSVAGDEYAIGYVSLGSLNDTVKALKIDGAEATAENIKAGTYKIARPFNIATKGDATGLAADFINYIMSSDGQDIIEKEGYIKVDEKAEAYKAGDAKGKVVVMGSSSVGPVMEKLAEAYQKTNKDITVEVQVSDSTTGINSATEGVCDIGMASRDLKDEETEKGVKATEIAKDGIAVIVNNESSVDELSTDQVKSIFTGETTSWSDITK